MELDCSEIYLCLDKKPNGAMPDASIRIYMYLGFELAHPNVKKVENMVLLNYVM